MSKQAAERQRLLIKARAQRELALREGGRDLTPPFYFYVPQYERLYRNNVFKYICLKGGRGSCKTMNSVCFLIEESFRHDLKNSLFLFAREMQTSVADSVYSVAKSMIEQAHLLPYFLITQTRIVNKLTGVEFAFIGLRATQGRTAFSQVNKVKGKFKVKYILVDESQDLTPESIDTLFPTVNRSSKVSIVQKDWHPNTGESIVSPDTRFIFCMNPNEEIDPILAKLNTYQHDSMLNELESNVAIIHMNIFDVPVEFQDPQLLDEAEAERGEIYFPHVWLGEPSHKLGGYPFNTIDKVQLKPRADVHILGAFLDPSFKGGDFTALAFVGIIGNDLICWGKCWPASWNRCVDSVGEELKQTPPDWFWYEDNSLGTVVQERFAMDKINAVPHCTTGNKEARIYRAAGYVVDRLSIVVNLCNSEFIQQVIKYNDNAVHDDGPDALASCLIKAGIIPKKVKF